MTEVIPLGTLKLVPLEPFHRMYRLSIARDQAMPERFFLTNTEGKEIEVNRKSPVTVELYRNEVSNKELTSYKPSLGIYKINRNGTIVSCKQKELNILKDIDLRKTEIIKAPLYRIQTNSVYDREEINIYGEISNNLTLMIYTDIPEINLSELLVTKKNEALEKQSKWDRNNRIDLCLDMSDPRIQQIFLDLTKYALIIEKVHPIFSFSELAWCLEVSCTYDSKEENLKKDVILPMIEIAMLKIKEIQVNSPEFKISKVTINIARTFRINI